MTKYIKHTLAVALLTVGLVSANQASAVPITGTIDFNGKVIATEDASHNVLVDFQAGTTFVDVDLPFTPTGDYAGITTGTAATFKDFSFNEGTLALTPNPVNPVWSVATSTLLYTFELTGLTVGDFSDLGSLDVEGYGIARITLLDGSDAGFEATIGTFTLGGAQSGAAGTRFTFSAGTSTVPDGGATAALLGCSFLGLAYVRNRFALIKA